MVLTTLALIFLPFRTCEFIVKYNRIGHRGPFSSVKYTIFIKFIKKYVKILLFEVSFFPTFFGAILGPIWLPFSGTKIHIFFPKISKNQRHQNTTPPLYKAFSSKRAPDPQNVPKRSTKCSQNASQNASQEASNSFQNASQHVLKRLPKVLSFGASERLSRGN